MRRRLNWFDRRRLLQFGAAGAAALAAAPLIRPAPRRAAAQGRGPLTGATDSGFTALPSALAFGAPADVAAGWDGTLWAVDASGAPSVYDPVAQEWVLHGTGIDAIAYVGVAGAGAAGTATPTAIPGATVGPPPLVPSTPAPTVAPPPLVPATGVPTVVPPPLVPATGVPTVVPPPLVPATPATAEQEEGQVVRIALAGAPAQQAGPTVTPVNTPIPAAPATHSPAAVVTATRAPRAPAGAASGYYVFRGPEVLYLPFTSLSGPAAPATATPSAAPATPMPPPAAPAVGPDESFVPVFAPNAPAQQEGLTPAPAGTANPARTPTPGATPSPTHPAATPSPGAPAPTATPPTTPAGAAVPLTPGVPQTFAALWPDLPASFKLGVRGAADVNGVLYLFKAGRYVRADGAAPPAKLTDIPGWPQTPTWKDGAVDLVGSGRGDGLVLLVRGGEYLVLDLSQPRGAINAGPYQLTSAFGGAFLAALQGQGGAVDAILFDQSVVQPDLPPWIFQGPAVSGFDRYNAGSTLQWRRYLGVHFEPRWPATWNPVLQQAPSGRVGALWAATTGNAVLTHDGEAWTQRPGGAVSVAAGADGSAYCVGPITTQLFRWDAAGGAGGAGDWVQVATAPGALSQVAVGDASRVWARGGDGTVRALAGGQLTPVPLVGPATHIAANQDGTVWSCDGSRPSAFRFISEAAAPPQALAAAGAVQKVASTGFGAAHVLVGQGDQAQVYRYDSPYVFKTSQSYNAPASLGVIEQGLGMLYLVSEDQPPGLPAVDHLVALDAHTGLEVSRSAPAPSGLFYGPPVFDPLQEAVYVPVTAGPAAPDSPSQLLALDARDLTTVRWSAHLGSALDSGLTLTGTRLCLADRSRRIYCFDTRVGPGATPAPLWVTPALPQESNFIAQRTLRPVITNGVVYAATWYAVSYSPNPNTSQALWLLLLTACRAADGSDLALYVVDGTPLFLADGPDFVADMTRLAAFPLALGRAHDAKTNQSAPALFVNGSGGVWALFFESAAPLEPAAPAAPAVAAALSAAAGAVGLNGHVPSATYTLPNVGAGGRIFSAFGTAPGGGGLWFGDSAGFLYGLDEQLQPLPGTPKLLAGGPSVEGIFTAPVVYTDAQGPTSVFAAWVETGRTTGLSVLDPTSGNVIAVSTGQTVVQVLSRGVVDGVLYAAGFGTGQPISQVFGIRVDEAVQGLRAFVAESALMQDFDPAPAGQPQPANTSGSARYQTHLTVLDDTRAPRPGTPIKIWADAPTSIQVNGQLVSVGPGDDQFAAAQTGTDGVVTLVTGSVAAGGSDKPDLSAAPLRIWAPFMDPYERLMVFPDREFHNRIATAHATDSGQSGADDPDRVNLQTTGNYGGKPLFDDQDKQQQQPQQVASAIQTMTSATGPAPAGGGGGAAVASWAGRRGGRGAARAGAAWVRRETDTPGAAGRYLAYDDLPGARYAPANTPSPRPVAIVQTAGMSYSRGATGLAGAPPGFSPRAPADAAAAIDALDGTPWEQSPHAPPQVRAAARAGAVQGVRVGSWWSSFWDWLKGIVADITHFIVSVAEDVYVGIRMIVDGIVYVFKQVVHAIEEVASAIGAFFKELVKLIEDVIEALSILFHFGEIIWTHKYVRDELLNRINGLPGNPTYPGFAALIQTNVEPPLGNFFEQAEGKVSGFFDQLADKIAGQGATASGSGGPGPGINQLKGQGATAHTTYTVQPKGGGQPSSHAPQCSWAMQKLKGGLGGPGGGGDGGALAQTLGRTLGRAPAAQDTDPLAAFIDTFAASISGDGELSSQWQQVQQGAQNMGHSASAGDFLRQGVAELLRILALIVDGALAVTRAFLDGFLDLIASLVSLMFSADPQNPGLLTQDLDIPVLSWLYQKVFGEPLTYLNVVTLVAAIPVTLLWRIVEGQWPRESVGVQEAARVGQISPTAAEVVGCFGAIITICAGLVAAVGDAEGDQSPPPLVGRLGLVCGVLGAVCGLIPMVTGDTPPGALDWAAWGVALGAGMLNVFGAIELTPGGAAENVFTYLMPGLLSLTSLAQLGIYIVGAVENPPADWAADLALATNIASTVAGIVNPAKLATELVALLVAILDAVMGFVVAGLQLGLVFASAP